MAIRILHTNDMHGTLSSGLLPGLRELRASCDLYFDSGDAIKVGNLGVPLRPEEVWPRLQSLRCTASVLGNRETHLLESAFRKKLEGAAHPVLCANLRRKDGTLALQASLELDCNRLRIGVFGVMVPMVTARMKTQAASAYLWEPPVETAKQMVTELRPRVDVLIALTHLGHRQDIALAEAAPEIDVILGGHSHTVVENPVQVGSTWVCQGGSHSRFAGVYEWSAGRLSGGLVPLRQSQ